MKTSEFISKLNDPALGKKMSEAKSAAEAYAVAKTAGVTDSLEDFMSEIGKLKTPDGELSEDELASVAGGWTISISPKQPQFPVNYIGKNREEIFFQILKEYDERNQMQHLVP